MQIEQMRVKIITSWNREISCFFSQIDENWKLWRTWLELLYDSIVIYGYICGTLYQLYYLRMYYTNKQKNQPFFTWAFKWKYLLFWEKNIVKILWNGCLVFVTICLATIYYIHFSKIMEGFTLLASLQNEKESEETKNIWSLRITSAKICCFLLHNGK